MDQSKQIEMDKYKESIRKCISEKHIGHTEGSFYKGEDGKLHYVNSETVMNSLNKVLEKRGFNFSSIQEKEVLSSNSKSTLNRQDEIMAM